MASPDRVYDALGPHTPTALRRVSGAVDRVVSRRMEELLLSSVHLIILCFGLNLADLNSSTVVAAFVVVVRMEAPRVLEHQMQHRQHLQQARPKAMHRRQISLQEFPHCLIRRRYRLLCH